ncbi:hypothetical protein [Metapseudomonas otitidis]|uniref:hypothetical protein n=1 Tax=Metapseudomonas otitidis TaxID=319939 RepID=UPI0013E0C77E|nr:hypothetical protein [Pseudomonas otitidis]
MKTVLKSILVLALLSSVGCSTVANLQAKRDADPAAYDRIDPNLHYFSTDRADWVEGS